MRLKKISILGRRDGARRSREVTSGVGGHGEEAEDDDVLHQVNAKGPAGAARFEHALGPNPTCDRGHYYSDGAGWLPEVVAEPEKRCG